MRSRPIIAGLVVIATVACGGSSKHLTSAKPLAVRADGTIDPNRIDLSGTSGTSDAEKKRAEDLLRRSILTLPKWNDITQATKDGFIPLGDRTSGEEHYVHWDWIEDNDIFDPNRPESLVYRRLPDGRWQLEAAMYILPKRYTLENPPDVGGTLVQFHTHTNLCFSSFPAPKFQRLAKFTDGSCPRPLIKLLTNVMIHAWIRPNKCGPFAPIGGFVSGTVRAGESPRCDQLHGGGHADQGE